MSCEKAKDCKESSGSVIALGGTGGRGCVSGTVLYVCVFGFTVIEC